MTVKLVIEVPDDAGEIYYRNMNAEAFEMHALGVEQDGDFANEGMSLTVDGNHMSVGVTRIVGVLFEDPSGLAVPFVRPIE